MDPKQATQRFYDLVWPYRSDVLRVAQFLSRNPTLAQDLAQETLLKAFRGIEEVIAGPRLKSWLLTILRNTWLDHVRAASAHREISFTDLSREAEIDDIEDSEELSEEWGDPQAVLEAFSDQEMIEALQALPEEIRWTLLLVDVEGLKLEETAELLGVPTGTIKSRAHRGRRMLRESLLPRARAMRLVPDVNQSVGRPEER